MYRIGNEHNTNTNIRLNVKTDDLPSTAVNLATTDSKLLRSCFEHGFPALLISLSVTTLPVESEICCCKSFLLTLRFNKSLTSFFSSSLSLL